MVCRGPERRGKVFSVEKKVRFPSGGIELAGTLSMPLGAGPHPALVLIHGGNPDNRDGGHGGFPMFKDLADHLVTAGIAVLRYDDRGMGESGGGPKWDHGYDQYVEDVEAAVGLLRGVMEIDSRRIGLVGFSLGGNIAVSLAGRSDGVAFVVSLAGPAVPGESVFLAFRRFLETAAGSSEAEIQRAVDLDRRLSTAVRGGLDLEPLKVELETRAREKYKGSSFDKDFKASWDGGLVASAGTKFLRSFLSHDPLPALRRLTCPAYLLFAGSDEMMDADENVQAAREALREAGNRDVLLEVVPGVRHLFTEPGPAPSSLAPGVMDKIGDWITGRVLDSG